MTQAPFPVDWRSPWEAPPIGVRIVAVYSDGSGAKLLVNLGGYFIEADGDSYCMDMDNWHRAFRCWAILPPAVQLFCERVDVEPVTLPPQPCTIRTQPLYTEIERILDEKSAWIARPSPEITAQVAVAALCAAASLEGKGLGAMASLAVARDAIEALCDDLAELKSVPRALVATTRRIADELKDVST